MNKDYITITKKDGSTEQMEILAIFRLEENVVVKYHKCNENWCKIEKNNKTGWIEAKNVWGYQL